MAAARLGRRAPAGPQMPVISDGCPQPTLQTSKWASPTPGSGTLDPRFALGLGAGESQQASPLRAHVPIASWGLWTEPCWFSKLDVLGARLSQVQVLKVREAQRGVQTFCSSVTSGGSPHSGGGGGRGEVYRETVSPPLLPAPMQTFSLSLRMPGAARAVFRFSLRKLFHM